MRVEKKDKQEEKVVNFEQEILDTYADYRYEENFEREDAIRATAHLLAMESSEIENTLIKNKVYEEKGDKIKEVDDEENSIQNIKLIKIYDRDEVYKAERVLNKEKIPFRVEDAFMGLQFYVEEENIKRAKEALRGVVSDEEFLENKKKDSKKSDDNEEKEKSKKKKEKVITIKEDIDIPGTEYTLEKGDGIVVI